MSKRKNALELESRQILYHTILKYPGLHFRELVRKIGSSEGTVRYHLNYLERRNLIIEKSDGGYVRYFVNDTVGNGDKELMAILRNKTQRYIILNLLFHSAGSCTKISRDLEKPNEVIRYHLQKLLKSGLIEKTKVENGYVKVDQGSVKAKEYNTNTNEVIFKLSNYHRINDFFIVNKKWFQDLITTELIKYSIRLEKNKHPKKISTFEKNIDKMLDGFKEVFHFPYYF